MTASCDRGTRSLQQGFAWDTPAGRIKTVGAGLRDTCSATTVLRLFAEYYILEAQNKEAWAVDDLAVDAKLEAFPEKNVGKSPNTFYILIDDIGFGDWGREETRREGA